MSAPEHRPERPIVATLKAAKAKIAKPENWIKGDLARDAGGYECYPDKHRAVQWCMAGAIQAVAGVHTQACTNATVALQQVIKRTTIAGFNDAKRRKHADVLAKFDEAIAYVDSHS